MGTIRHTVVSNNTGAPIFQMSPPDGVDLKKQSIYRLLSAPDIGAAAGQTQDAGGCLVYTASGTKIKAIMSFSILRPSVIPPYIILETLENLGYKISDDKRSIYFLDQANPPFLQEDDTIAMTVLVGN
jgi:hypothetical protein